MKQTSLFETSTNPDDTSLALIVRAPTLNRAQKQFNKLLREIAQQERALQRWQDYLPRYRQRVEAEFWPLRDRERECRIALVGLLDHAITTKRLSATDKATASDLLMEIVDSLLANGDEPELIAMHDKYSATSHVDLVNGDREELQAFVDEIFGDEPAPDPAHTSPEEFAARVAEKMAAREQAEQADASARKPRRKSTKAQAREDLLQQTALDASQALREVYRKLVRELHPDRETDPAERLRKTDLMKQANQAYAARNLPVLLQLQLRLEQIDPTQLTDLAQEKLLHFNHVLKDQLQSLRHEIGDIVAPFLASIVGVRPDELQPAHVERALDEDRAQLEMLVHTAQNDLQRLTDLAALKRELKQYRAATAEETLDEMIQDMLLAQLVHSSPKPGRKVGAKKPKAKPKSRVKPKH